LWLSKAEIVPDLYQNSPGAGTNQHSLVVPDFLLEQQHEEDLKPTGRGQTLLALRNGRGPIMAQTGSLGTQNDRRASLRAPLSRELSSPRNFLLLRAFFSLELSPPWSFSLLGAHHSSDYSSPIRVPPRPRAARENCVFEEKAKFNGAGCAVVREKYTTIA
jgi:hypothetical protein